MAANDVLIQRLRELSTTITNLKISAGQCARDLDLLVEMVKSLDRHPSQGSQIERVQIGRFTIDRKTFSVSDGNHICELGNTLCYHFFELLASEPNRCFTQTQLLAAVWDGRRRTASTVRSAVFELRRRFRTTGLDELAHAIRAHGKAYGLRIDDPLSSTQPKTNG